MSKKILFVMAAGMGSRYGGLKQIDPLGPSGEVILEYSVYDAIRAGFNKVIFLIKEEMQADFESKIASKLRHKIEVAYAFQKLEKMPISASVPEGRVKPWGTAHAIICAEKELDAPFAALNADDYYGISAFQKMSDFLDTLKQKNAEEIRMSHYAMVAYLLKNTVSKHGSVARGLCQKDAQGQLISIRECTSIVQKASGEIFDEESCPAQQLDPNTLVSMNFWAFSPDFVQACKAHFPEFYKRAQCENPLKAEFYLPTVVTSLLKSQKAKLTVLDSDDQWFGVTYQEDKGKVKTALAEMHQKGFYPQNLWT